MLAYDTASTASIAATLAAARESARRARETLSTSMWEAMNTTYRAIPSGHFRSMRPPVAFRWVRDRAAQINGIAEATMTRDEGYQFLVLGRSIERADMTSRLVATAALTSGSAWGTSLRACGAYEAFLRTYKGLETERGAAEFLLLDRLFPRSVVFGLSQAERCLERLSPPAPGPASRTRPSGCSAGPAPSWSTARSATSSPSCPTRWNACNAPARWRPTRSRRRYFAGAEATEWHGVEGMSMQLRIAHTTGFEYDGKANTSFNEARLTPLTLPGQIVVHSRVEVSPTPWAYTYRDYWGAQVTAFEVLDPHQSLTVTASATVHTDRSPAGRPGMSWEDMRSDEVADVHTEFLALPDRVRPDRRPGRRWPARSPTRAPTPGRRRARDLRAGLPARSSTSPARPPSTPSPRTRGPSGPGSARTWRTSRSARCGRSASRRATCPATCTPSRSPRSAYPPRASRTPGSSGGTTAGAASTRPTTPSPATGTSSSPPAATTTTSSRSSGIFSGTGTSRMFVDVQVTRLQ